MSQLNTFTTLTTNGSTAGFQLDRVGTDLNIFLTGTVNFGSGGVLTMETSPDGGTTWVAYPTGIWSTAAAGLIGKFMLSAPLVRFTLSNATAAASITIQVQGRDRSVSLDNYKAFTANGNADVHLPRPTSTVEVYAYGTWDGATVAVSYSPDALTTLYSVGSATADGIIAVDNVADLRDFRVAVSSAGASTDLKVRTFAH